MGLHGKLQLAAIKADPDTGLPRVDENVSSELGDSRANRADTAG